MSDQGAPDLELLEELTAYLDGELDGAARERVERRLANDSDYRHELQRLERSWDLLDRLPRSTVDDTFTQSTLEMVAVAAEDDLQADQASRPRGRSRLVIAVAVGALLAGLGGFAFGHWLWPDPNRELLRDLPVLTNLDLYQHADSVEFLRALLQSKRVPLDEAIEEQPRWRDLNDAALRQHIEQLAPLEQQQLLRLAKRFHELPVAEQNHLRHLQADLESDPQASQLFEAMRLYHEWLKTLTPGQRAELVELPTAERLTRLRQLDEQSRPRTADNQMLTQEDLRRMGAWIEGFIWKHKDRILADAPIQRRAFLETLDEPMRRRALMIGALQRWQSIGLTDLTPSPEEIQQLEQQLSPAAQQRLTAAQTSQEKKTLLKEWVGLAVQQRLEMSGRGLAMVDERELERFFAENLSSDERDRLLSMPRDQMQRELKRLYFQGAGRRPNASRPMRPEGKGPMRPEGALPPRPDAPGLPRRGEATLRELPG